jgi:crotonobetainyl-CoA:carnitine CoA-transferase CaiB-like acyl-CoA transferase
MEPLAGILVVDLSRYLPGPFATRELLRLGARVVRLEPPEGDPMRSTAPAWDAALNAGKESVALDLKSAAGLHLARALVERADVVVEGFRPGVLERLGLSVPETAVLCAITGFGSDGRNEQRAGHDLNYLGFAGALADTAPALPPVQVADLAAGALASVVEILAALLERSRTGRGARLELSMTHGAHRLVAHRLGGDPVPRLLTGGVPCYAIYPTADGRWLTVGALEPRFWRRLCELLERPDLVPRQFDPAAIDEVAALFRERPLAAWLALCDGEDVCVGPVLTLREAAEELDTPAPPRAAALGEHTELWRRELSFELDSR